MASPKGKFKQRIEDINELDIGDFEILGMFTVYSY